MTLSNTDFSILQNSFIFLHEELRYSSLLILLDICLMINSREVSDKERDIQYPLGTYPLHTETSLPLPLSYLMRSLDKCHNFSISNAEHGTATSVFHDPQVALDLSHLEEFPPIHSESARVVIVSQV